MSTLPRKCAPSEMTIFGARTFPSREPEASSSTRSSAVTSPFTFPEIVTFFAWIFASTEPPVAMTRFFLRLMVPSTRPWISTSSSPEMSPISLIWLPITVNPPEALLADFAGPALGAAAGGELGGSDLSFSLFPNKAIESRV